MNWLKKILGMEPDKLFYPGQEVTPLKSPNWIRKDTNEIMPGPKFGEVVKVVKYSHLSDDGWYIEIMNYRYAFKESEFAPVISSNQLEEMLQEVGELTIAHGTF